ncbi:MAG: transporter [Candidatus Coatesbacteria bacterium]|nr:transporter [Candidatus Coatesbacteria bacterium]
MKYIIIFSLICLIANLHAENKSNEQYSMYYESSYGGFTGRGTTISADVLPNGNLMVNEGFEFYVWGRDPDFNIMRFNTNLIYGMFNWMEVDLSIPILIRKAKDQDIESHKGLGDMHGGAKFMIYPDSENMMGLSVFGQLTLPTGNSNRDLGGEVALRGGCAISETYDIFKVDAHFEYGWAKMTDVEGQKFKGSSFENYSITTTVLPEAPMSFRISAVGSSKSNYLDYPLTGFRIVPGAKIMLMKEMYLDAGFAWGLNPPPELGFNIGLSYRFKKFLK